MTGTSNELAHKKALVIGGSRGIGRAIVERLAASGADVAFTFTSNPQKAAELAAELTSGGRRVLALRADSADARALEAAIDRAAELLGGLDIVVNNAGILIHGPVDEFSLDDFDRMIDVNVRAVFVAAKAATRHLPRGGKLLVVGSNTADRAMAAGSAIYGMTKAAVARLVRGLAWDFAPRGIAVINVQPGPTATDIVPTDGPVGDWVRSRSPEQRFAAPDEIARFVTYLAGPDSTYINGASLTIDGGFSA